MLNIEKAIARYGDIVDASIGDRRLTINLSKLVKAMTFVHESIVTAAPEGVQSAEALSTIELRAVLKQLLGADGFMIELFKSVAETITFDLKKDGRMVGSIPITLPQDTIWPYADGVSGMLLIMGATESGKTYHALNTLDPDLAVRVGEPPERRWDDTNVRAVVHPSSIGDAVAIAIAFAAAGVSVSLDSLRLMMRELPGAAAKGGVSASFETALTAINNLFVIAGVTIACVLNPLDADSETTQTYFRNAASSIMGVVMLENKAVVKETYRGAEDRTTVDFRDNGPREKTVSDQHRNLTLPQGHLSGMGIVAPVRAVPDLNYNHDSMLRALDDDAPDMIAAELLHRSLTIKD